MVVQQNYAINPPVGFPGMIAEPNSPTRVERGRLFLSSATGNIDPRFSASPSGARPGDSVYYDTTNNAWRVAHSGATQLLVAGIITYPADTVAGTDSIVVYGSGAEIEVVTMGVVWVTAGGASERGQQIFMQTDDWKYDVLARVTTVSAMHITPIVNFSTEAVADNALVKAAIGYGRAI